MIETLWALGGELWDYLVANFDPARDLIDITLVTVGIYWLLLLIQGTRAVQIVVGLIVLFALYLTSQLFQLATLELVLGNFLQWGIIIIIVLFQQDIRRGLARVGRGFFPSVAAREESQMLEELVRAAQTLAQRKVGALIVLERENHVGEQIETGSALDASVSKDLLVSLFMPYSPLHDGAAVVADGRIAYAGCILPLTLREDLPEGVGTRHRAAVGVTEETDAVVIVVSEETGTISVVLGGEMIQGLDAPRLRAVLRDILSGERSDLHHLGELRSEPGPETAESAQTDALRTAG
ncbi:MAG TPA: diadenylate cyclase CdaA [Myxococcota bacterium]|jgi:diadenylate cyclase|nr:diadenylate cyclase CdaA [Myxococcota bacterium]